MAVIPIRNMIRLALALLLAADAAAVLIWAIMGFLAAPVFALALLHAIVFGLPSYLIICRRRPATIVLCVASGAIIGASPLAVLTLSRPFLLPKEEPISPAFPEIVVSVNLHAGIIPEPFGSLMLFALHGAVAGGTFFVVMRLT